MSSSETSICSIYEKKSVEDKNTVGFPIGDSSDVNLKQVQEQSSTLKRKSLNQKHNIKQKGDHNSEENENKEDENEVLLSNETTLGQSKSKKTLEKPKNHYGRLGEHLKELWIQQNMSDVVLRVNKKLFAAHKSVLTCYCPFLKRHLLARGRQGIQGIDLQNVDPDSFEILLNYMYTGQLNISCQNLVDVYNASRSLEMEDVSKHCIKMLINQNDNISSKLFLYATAKKLGIQKVSQRAYKAILHKFDEISGTNEFLDLDVEQLCEILNSDQIGTHSEINVFLSSLNWLNYKFIEREKHIVRVMSCVRFPLMTMEEVLSCYHPPILPGIVEFPEVENVLLKATCFIAARTVGRETKFHEFSCPPRVFTCRSQNTEKKIKRKLLSTVKKAVKIRNVIKVQSFLRAYSARKKLKEQMTQREFAALIVQSYRRGSITRKKWRPFLGKTEIPGEKINQMEGPLCDPCLHVLLQHPSSTTLNSIDSSSTDDNCINIPRVRGALQLPNTSVILAIGGINPSREEEIAKGIIVLRYDPIENIWEQWDKMPIHRHHHCTVMLEDKLYIIGGCDARDTMLRYLVPCRSCFRYDLKDNEWSRIADMKHARLYHGAAEIDGKIYVVGGKDDNGKLLSSVECYTPATDCWTELQSSLCCARMAMGIAVHKDLLWIVGGIMQPTEESKPFINKDVECFDPICQCWLSGISRLPTPRSFATLVQCQDVLYAIGGTSRNYSSSESSLESIDDVHVFDDVKNQWKLSSSLSYPRHNVSATSLNDKIYILGGVSTMQVDPLRECCVYDTSTNTWMECAPLPVPLSGLSAVVLYPSED
ncbi:kelch-like protein diablo [Centruroides vittatus]|uniref:kelch-like protein diablo n=1 Tax=Centruroides vittatus TaxID=120091 RepID=UPI00350E91A7